MFQQGFKIKFRWFINEQIKNKLIQTMTVGLKKENSIEFFLFFHSFFFFSFNIVCLAWAFDGNNRISLPKIVQHSISPIHFKLTVFSIRNISF